MEPNKFETNIKNQLNSREIKPTEMAWDRLDAMLTVAEEKKSKKGFNWMLIAACFIGVLFLGTVVYQFNNDKVVIENTVVTKEKMNQEEVETEIKINPNVVPIQQENQVATSESNVENIKSKQNSIINQKVINQNSKINQKETENPNLNLDKEIQFQNQEVIGQLKMQTVDTKTKIATVKPEYVSADELLASVDKARKSVKQTSVKVNANSLLSQVDGELNQDFRETRFQKFKRNFETVKVAVANRNNQ